MEFRDRVKELRRVPARELRRHPLNWRRHPASQRAVLEGVLGELGFAGALVARELEDGTLELIDGHLRAETAGSETVPVLVVDLSEVEAKKLLSVYDPIGGMAERDGELWEALQAGWRWNDEAVAQLVDGMAGEGGPPGGGAEPDLETDETRRFQVVVDCEAEQEQRELFERLTAEGRRCRLLMLW